MTKQHVSRTRVVGYCMVGPDAAASEAESLLRKAQKSGESVMQFGLSGGCLWFNGRPGSKLRRVRKRLVAMGWTSTLAAHWAD